MCFLVHPCIFQPKKFTGWENEGVNCLWCLKMVSTLKMCPCFALPH